MRASLATADGCRQHPIRFAAWLLILSWLAGCAVTGPAPRQQTPTPERNGSQVSTPPAEQETAAATEETPVPGPAETGQKALTATRALAAMDYVAALNALAAKQRIERLQDRRLEHTAGERLELALLLSRDSMDDRSLKQALQLLKGLANDAEDAGVQALLQLQQHSLEREQRYRAERRKTAELARKIEHLKGLERELDESNKRMEEPLTPKPGQTP